MEADVNGSFDLSDHISNLGITRKTSRKMQKKLSIMKSENVLFKYEYADEDVEETATIYISGQFNNWDFEEMTKVSTGKYNYEKMIKGG